MDRPYKLVTKTERNNSQESPSFTDEEDLTQYFLSSHTMDCTGCGAWIMRRGGCANMRCRCGQSFVWNLGITLPQDQLERLSEEEEELRQLEAELADL